MSEVLTAMGLAALAGVAIPVGAAAACFEGFRPRWLEQELRHAVVAFGGGVLLAAVALVLVPEGLEAVSTLTAASSFAAGGAVFFVIDRRLQQRVGAGAQLLAMLLDFVPEAMALGALLASGQGAGPLLALLIGLQNLPEGFNAFRELRSSHHRSRARLLLLFVALVPLGPLAAWCGHAFLAGAPGPLGVVMLFAAGGILYLTFQDIAPQAKLERHWAPPLGAVGGFLLGLVGQALLG